MAAQNVGSPPNNGSRIMNLINDDVKSIIPEPFSPIQLSNEEIPIFIGKNAMRWISGITINTTSYEIIQGMC